MNWKDPIILGAIAGSEKFEADLEPLTSIKNDIWKLAGIIDGTLILERGEVLQENNTFESEQVEVNDIKLIARPIEDMSDNEEDNYHDLLNYHYQDNMMPTPYDSPESFLYLLSIGVYPFSDTTGVIFKEKK